MPPNAKRHKKTDAAKGDQRGVIHNPLLNPASRSYHRALEPHHRRVIASIIERLAGFSSDW